MLNTFFRSTTTQNLNEAYLALSHGLSLPLYLFLIIYLPFFSYFVNSLGYKR
jgi:hypothetical protein